MNKKPKEIVNVRKINKMRWIAAFIVSALVIVISTVSTALNISDYYHNGTEAGFGTLKMFTTLSNLLAAIAAFMCLPFQIDGLKKDKYKLPPWIVTLLYVGASGTFLTFIIAITLISANKGFVEAMFVRSNLYMHTLNPIFITILFTLIISDSHIKFRYTFLTLIPVLLYSFLYLIMVFIAHIWDDHYQTNSFIPWPVTFIIIISVAYGASLLLRFLHNLSHKYVSNNIRRYYLESSDYDFKNIKEAVKKLAEVESNFYTDGDEISIPTDVIAMLYERYGDTSIPLHVLYNLYLEHYLTSVIKK